MYRVGASDSHCVLCCICSDIVSSSAIWFHDLKMNAYFLCILLVSGISFLLYFLHIFLIIFIQPKKNRIFRENYELSRLMSLNEDCVSRPCKKFEVIL